MVARLVSVSRLTLGLATVSLSGLAIARQDAIHGLDRRPCPHFITEDGPDEDTTPDDVPTVPEPGTSDCALRRDVTGLIETLELSSGTSLDCRGHTITPSAKGTEGDPNSRSVPELAFLVHDVSGVQIKNCIVEGFDHGIFAANNKAPTSGPPSNVIAGNVIDSRFVGVHLTASDRFLVEGNTITWRTRGGAGIFLHFDSDQNVVRGNRILGRFDAATVGAVLFPGPSSPSNPVFPSGPGGHGAVLVVQFLGPHPHLFNAVIGGRLLQFEDAYTRTPSEAFSADNTIEWNNVTFCRQNLTEDGIVASNTLRTTVAHNTLGRAFSEDCPNGGSRLAIRAGSIFAEYRYPGRCELKTGRRCLDSTDCNIPSIDDPAAPDTCASVETRTAEWYPIGFKAVDNTILSPFQAAVATSGDGSVIEGNHITGPLRPNGQQPVAVFVLEGKYANDTAVVTRNEVRDATTLATTPPAPRPAALFYLFRSRPPNAVPADGYHAKISLNNFYPGYAVAIRTGDDYDFDAELSVDGYGNYWGLSCDEGGFDETKVVRVNGTLNSFVADSHPYGAALPDLAADPDLEGFPPICSAP